MVFKQMKKYLGVFILAIAAIIVYKTFDNFKEVLGFFGMLGKVLMPFILGAAFAFILRPLCAYFERLLKKTNIKIIRNNRRGLGVLLTVFVMFLVVALLLIAIIPQLISSITKFIEQLPDMLNKLTTWINSLGFIHLENITIQGVLNNDFFSINDFLKSLDMKNVNKYAQGVMSVGTLFANIGLGFMVALYILADRAPMKRAILRMTRAYIPTKIRKPLLFYTKKVGDFINRYISCQLLDACVVFVLCLIVLSIMRNEYAALIALMVGSFNLIPYFGAPIAVFISALIILVTHGFGSAVVVTAVLIVIQQVDANLIQPRLVASSLSLKPLWVIFGVMVGGGLFGFVGMFIGVPLVALCKDILSDIISKRLNKKKAIAAAATDADVTHTESENSEESNDE